MHERPILFSGPMVRAILNDTKSQTRRVVKNPDHFGCLTGDCPHETSAACTAAMRMMSPYGSPGDRLWVRESWAYRGGDEYIYQQEQCCVQYRSTDEYAYSLTGQPRGDEHWRPSIFMPRWASRLTLTITDVRVERLHDISEADARAEGVATWRYGWTERDQAEAFLQGTAARLACGDDSGTAKRLYYLLWQQINADRGFDWDANPWVWVVSFERTHPDAPGGR